MFRTALGAKLTAALDAFEVAFEANNAASTVSEQDDDPWSVAHGLADLISLDTQLFETLDLTVHPVAPVEQAVLRPTRADARVRSTVPNRPGA